MKLWTFQSVEVLEQLSRDKIFFADWSKLSYPEFCDAYEWMINQFNHKRNHEFSGPPIFWYTNIKQVKESLRSNLSTENVLLNAEVPDKLILLHDSGLWHCPLNNCGIGFESVDETRGDRLWRAYKNNREAMEESWKEIFHLPKRDKYLSDIHAVTPYIDLYWMKPWVSSNSANYE